jgi:hypothetical protein
MRPTNERDYRLVKEVNGKPITIRYQPNAFWGDNLERHLYTSGFSGVGLTDYTFEVNEDWEPYWTVTTYDSKVGFMGDEATGTAASTAVRGQRGRVVAIHDAQLYLQVLATRQYQDLATRQTIDTIAGITSTLVRYPRPGMRGHVQVVCTPAPKHFRRDALKFLPLLYRGLSKRFEWYAKFFTEVHMSYGWQRVFLFPMDMLMGGFRTWFSRSKLQISMLSGSVTERATADDEEKNLSMRSHEREDKISGAVDKLNRLLFCVNVPRVCRFESCPRYQHILRVS